MRRLNRVTRLARLSGRYIGVASTLGLLASHTAQAQSASATTTTLDISTLGRAQFSRMHTKLEKTIFKVDVLAVDVWLGDEDAAQVERRVAGKSYTNELAESVADVAIHSQDAFIRIEFLRDVSLEQFLDGVDENLRRVPEAGIIERSDYLMISERLPSWFGFLEEGGIRKGDQILYRIRGDSLTTQFLTVTGESLLDQTDVGPERRRAVLGSYFVRKSDFSEGLVRSLLESPEP
jgi:hypothetical protein